MQNLIMTDDSMHDIEAELPAEPTSPERRDHLDEVIEEVVNACYNDDATSEHESETESVAESVQNEPEMVTQSVHGRRYPSRNRHKPNRWQSDPAYKGCNAVAHEDTGWQTDDMVLCSFTVCTVYSSVQYVYYWLSFLYPCRRQCRRRERSSHFVEARWDARAKKKALVRVRSTSTSTASRSRRGPVSSGDASASTSAGTSQQYGLERSSVMQQYMTHTQLG